MRDLRSIVNAGFCFFLFLLVYAFTVPGHAHGKAAPRFLRMEILEGGSSTNPGRVSFSVPFGLVRHSLRAAVGGRVRRELNSRFDESIDASELRGLAREVAEKPEGTEVVRTFDGTRWSFVRSGGTVTATVGRPGTEEGSDDSAAIKFPATLLDHLAERDRPLDVDALLSEMTSAAAGSLLEIESRDGKVRVWID